jgi:DNA-binding NtrC family response regulator
LSGKRKILVIDDEIDMLETSGRLLKRLGYECSTLNDSTQVTTVLAEVQPEIVLTDLMMPKVGGFEVLKTVQNISPETLVIMVTGYATVDTAIKAIKEGAFDYLPKPFSYEQLEVVVKRAEEKLDLKAENQSLKSQIEEIFDFDNIIGASSGMHKVVKTIKKLSNSDANILLLGESGTGKELIARSIHVHSKRNQGPFVAVNCASLPHDLLESELFGHERGAFTGAHSAKTGLMEMADTGTLFLDEIGEMNKELQAKLLRALELRSFRRVGGTKEVSVDIRILAATNRDLEEAVLNGAFREDLYYRLNVISIHLPPLRERVQDIPLLALHFLKHFSQREDKKVQAIGPIAMEQLRHYHWPGNVRELKNIMERAVALCEKDIVKIEDLPERLTTPRDKSQQVSNIGVPNIDLSFHEAKAQWVDQFEVKYLKQLLQKYSGNISEAARNAGVDRKTIHRLLQKHKL